MLDAWNFQDMQTWRKYKIWQILGVSNEGILFKQGPQNSKFNHLRCTDEIFRIGKNEEKIKFEKIWEYKMKGSSSHNDAKI